MSAPQLGYMTTCTFNGNATPVTIESILKVAEEFRRLMCKPKRKKLVMPTNPDQLAFLKAIEAQPTEDFLKLIYADWLEERGDPECEAWRWLAAEKKMPSQDDESILVGRLFWSCPHSRLPEAAWLPEQVYNKLPNQQGVNGRYQGCQLKAVMMALVATAQAFVLARKNGWEPYPEFIQHDLHVEVIP